MHLHPHDHEVLKVVSIPPDYTPVHTLTIIALTPRVSAETRPCGSDCEWEILTYFILTTCLAHPLHILRLDRKQLPGNPLYYLLLVETYRM